MTITLCSRVLAVFLMIGAAASADPVSGSVIIGLSSTKNNGMITILSDPTLSDDRLMLKVVAFNRGKEPAQLDPGEVHVTTAAGKTIAVVPLEKLIADVRKANTRSRQRLSSSHDPANYSGPSIARNSAGEPDVSGYTGGGASPNGEVSMHTQSSRESSSQQLDAQAAEQVTQLQAAILQPVAVPPGKAVGGQIVTEKIRFGRKEARTLKVSVQFNGELHEFSFDAPLP